MRRSDVLVLALLVPFIAAPVAVAARRGQDESKTTACSNNLAQMWKMMGNYMVQFGGVNKRLPEETGHDFWFALSRTSPPLIDRTALDIFQCPVEGFADEGCDYRGPKADANALADADPVGADVIGNHGAGKGGNVIRKWGDVQTVSAEDRIWIRAGEMTSGGNKAVPVPAKPYPQKRSRALVDIGHLVVAVWMYHEVHGEFPKHLRHLVAARSPAQRSVYLHDDMVAPEGGFLPGGKLPTDPWGNDYQYEVRSGQPHVWSRGADGKKGGEGEARDLTMEDVFSSPERKCPERVRELSQFVHMCFGTLKDYPPSGNRNLARALLVFFGSDAEFDRRLVNDKGEWIDVWGRPYVYRNNKADFPKNQNDPTARNKQTFDLYSVGANGIDEKGAGDDIGNWMFPSSGRNESGRAPVDFGAWIDQNDLGRCSMEEFRLRVHALEGQRVSFRVRVRGIDAGKNVRDETSIALISADVPTDTRPEDIPAHRRVFLLCIAQPPERFDPFKTGDVVIVSGMIVGTGISGIRPIRLSNFSFRSP